jgi:hypothetical protein
MKAEDLPFGTIMILGGDEYNKRASSSGYGWVRSSQMDGLLLWCCFSDSAIQELIDRGVEFRLPKGGDS